MQHFNELRPGEHERLAMLIEECGEVIQAAGKVLRHGYLSWHPDAKAPDEDHSPPNNRDDLMREITDLLAVVHIMHKRGDIQWPSESDVQAAENKKRRYAHHQAQR